MLIFFGLLFEHQARNVGKDGFRGKPDLKVCNKVLSTCSILQMVKWFWSGLDRLVQDSKLLVLVAAFLQNYEFFHQNMAQPIPIFMAAFRLKATASGPLLNRPGSAEGHGKRYPPIQGEGLTDFDFAGVWLPLAPGWQDEHSVT